MRVFVIKVHYVCVTVIMENILKVWQKVTMNLMNRNGVVNVPQDPLDPSLQFT